MRYFRINRTLIGYTVNVRMRYFPYWYKKETLFHNFTDCLLAIKEYCCSLNEGKACIYDPDGPNKKMVINYRRYKGEILNELPQ